MTPSALAAVAWLATYAVHSTVLLAVAWLVARSLRATAGRETLLRAALFGGLATATVQSALGGPDLFRLDRPGAAVEPASAAVCSTAVASTAPPAAGTPESPAGPVAGPVAPAADPAPAGGPDLPILLLAVWGLGAVVGLGRLVASHVALRARLRDRRTVSADDPAARLFERVRARGGVRRAVRLTATDALAGPVGFGLRRPEVCVPERALVELAETELEGLFAHELAHVVRRDPLWLFLARALEAAFFFQPLNRVARARLADLAEEDADAWAARRTGRPGDLARCLCRVATWLRPADAALPAPGMAASGSRLRRRVEALLAPNAGSPPRRRPYGWSASMLLLVAAVVPGVAVGEGCATPPEEPAAEAPGPAGDGAEAVLASLVDEIDRLREDVSDLSERVRAAGLQDSHGPLLADIDNRLRAVRDRCTSLSAGLADARQPDPEPRESTGDTE